MDLALITRAILMTASRVMLPLCLMFFTFFLSRGGSFSSFSNIAEAVGIIVGVAWQANSCKLLYVLHTRYFKNKMHLPLC